MHQSAAGEVSDVAEPDDTIPAPPPPVSAWPYAFNAEKTQVDFDLQDLHGMTIDLDSSHLDDE